MIPAKRYENGGMVYLREGQPRGLPPEIFAYSVLDYWDRNFCGLETLSTQDVGTFNKQASHIELAHDIGCASLILQDPEEYTR